MAEGFLYVVWWNSFLLLLNPFGLALPGSFTKPRTRSRPLRHWPYIRTAGLQCTRIPVTPSCNYFSCQFTSHHRFTFCMAVYVVIYLGLYDPLQVTVADNHFPCTCRVLFLLESPLSQSRSGRPKEINHGTGCRTSFTFFVRYTVIDKLYLL